MPAAHRVIHNTYRDSVALMQISAEIAALPGVSQAALFMATEANLALLRDAGLLQQPLLAAPSDLVAVVTGESEDAVSLALAEAERALSAPPAVRRGGAAIEQLARSSEMGLTQVPDANLALISTPGEYAAAEALKALRLGLHVMLFSDNISLADELTLKRAAARRGLLMMGPDCGTAIVAGVPLGFANAVRRGPVGVIGASGTGTQQVTTLLDRAGVGVSHALGTGGRDLRVEIGGATMLAALDELGADVDTRVIVLISKPPAPVVAEHVLARAKACEKPVVVCFLGAEAVTDPAANIFAAATLEQAAMIAAALARGDRPERTCTAVTDFAAPSLVPEQKFLRGLFSGGTFCYEATLLLARALTGVHSNTPVGAALDLGDVWRSRGHTLVDLGDDEFTRGRPHPMIDFRLRNERMLREAEDPEVAVILFDVVLGYGAHPDPAAELVPAIKVARTAATRPPAFVAFVCGSAGDPQGLARQEAALRAAGVILAANNAAAARTAAAILQNHGPPT